MVPALAPAPSLPPSGLSFPIWRRNHESSVLGSLIHVSLVWVIGQAVGDTLPGPASFLLGAPESGAQNELSAWLDAIS